MRRKAGDVTVDLEADMAYIYLEENDGTLRGEGETVAIPVEVDGNIKFVIDTDASGRLLGIEVFSVDMLGPAMRAKAIDLKVESARQEELDALTALGLSTEEVGSFWADEAYQNWLAAWSRNDPGVVGTLQERVDAWRARKKK